LLQIKEVLIEYLTQQNIEELPLKQLIAQLRVWYLSGQTDSVYYKEYLQSHDYSIWIKRLKNCGICTVIQDTVFSNNVMIFKNGPEVFLSFCAVNANLTFRQ